VNFHAEVERVFSIDRPTMWTLWTDEEHAGRWMRPSLTEFEPTIASIDPRPSGTYRFEMIGKDGSVRAVSGQFVEVDEPKRLVFTWSWDGSEEESLVEVLLSEVRDGTKVSISHTRFDSQESAEQHEDGWVGCLASITHLA
jgi:uncharacterized protein YndB with AHSA1/START domain